ncbi:AI-2E family transporter [Sphingoaurantiacus capsulatus]|uniref:AI-2E family transporter n=1 Tax=Sphingoaurantiacus capsulatus TaxID=1771310 RepID=A0ABV7X9P0_9SPHN
MRDPETTAPTGGGNGWRVALGIIAAIAATAAMRELAGILVPLVIAVFLMLMVETIAGVVDRHVPVVPRWGGRVLGVLALALALAGSVWVVGAYAASLVNQAAAVSGRIDRLLTSIAHSFNIPPIRLDRLVGEEEITAIGTRLLGEAQGFASGVLFVAIYLGFLLASRRSLALKFGRLFARDGARPNARRVMHRVQDATEQYIWVQTVTGLAIALGSWAIMAAVGLQSAPLLAFIIFLTSYIPVVGPFLGVIIPPVVGLAQFDGLTEPLILLVGLQAINFLLNNIIVPRMQSDRLNLDPIVVLLSLGFWTWLWGMPGAFLSTPLTALVMAVTAEIPSVRWIAILLSKDGEPTVEAKPKV